MATSPPAPAGSGAAGGFVLTNEFLLRAYFGEVPNEQAATAALALMGAVLVAVTAVTVKTRAWYMATVAVTAALELAGFATRLRLLRAPSLNLFIIHQAFLIISPVLLAIVEYITLSKLLRLSLARTSPDSTSSPLQRFTQWFFLGSDVVCLLLQAAGGGMISNPPTAAIARQLLLAGLAAQLAFFTCFFCLTVHVHASRRFGFRGSRQFLPVFVCLYATTALLQARNVFRCVEFAQGFRGRLATTESFFYALDFSMVWLTMALFSGLHFGWWLGPSAPPMPGVLQLPHASPAAAAAETPRGKQAPSAHELVVVQC